MERLLQNKVFLTFAGALCLFGLYTLLVPQKFGSQMPTQTTRYTAFSTSTLSTSFTGGGAASSSRFMAKGMENAVIAGTYLPKTVGGLLQLDIETSIDDGLTFRPYNSLSASSTQVFVYATTSLGLPFTIPGSSGQTASGTAITFNFPLPITADYLKISAREVVSSTAGILTATPGTVSAQVYFQSK